MSGRYREILKMVLSLMDFCSLPYALLKIHCLLEIPVCCLGSLAAIETQLFLHIPISVMTRIFGANSWIGISSVALSMRSNSTKKCKGKRFPSPVAPPQHTFGDKTTNWNCVMLHAQYVKALVSRVFTLRSVREWRSFKLGCKIASLNQTLQTCARNIQARVSNLHVVANSQHAASSQNRHLQFTLLAARNVGHCLHFLVVPWPSVTICYRPPDAFLSFVVLQIHFFTDGVHSRYEIGEAHAHACGRQLSLCLLFAQELKPPLALRMDHDRCHAALRSF